jgi:uncharacterized protein YgiM (DUF1202 family)
MLRQSLTVCFTFIFFQSAVADTGALQCVVVAEPYLELHTGPGEVYPVTHVFERDEQICVVKRRTDWFKITGGRDKEGWVHRDQLLGALRFGDYSQHEIKDVDQ